MSTPKPTDDYLKSLGTKVAERRRNYDACMMLNAPVDEVERMRATIELERALDHLIRAEAELRDALTRPHYVVQGQKVEQRPRGDWQA